jgi:hypothetical protein
MPAVPLVALSASSASVRRPVSGVSVQCPRVRCPRDRCPVSGVRRPVSGVSVRCPCVPASAVSEPGEVVERGGAAGSHTARPAGVGVVARGIRDRLVVCPRRSLALEAGAGRAGPAAASAWTWPSSWEVLGQRPGSTVWPPRDKPVAREDRSSEGSGVRGEVPPPAAWLRAGHQGMMPDMGRHQGMMPDMGRHALSAGWPAREGPLGLTARRARGPTAAQAGNGCDRSGGGSALSWENSGGPART